MSGNNNFGCPLNHCKYDVDVISVYDEEYRYLCDRCGKKYKRLGNFTNHEKICKSVPLIILPGEVDFNSDFMKNHEDIAYYKE